MIRVLQIIQELSRGGAARALLYLAKYSDPREFKHSVLSLLPPDPQAVNLARELGIEVYSGVEGPALSHILSNADIVQCNWWNNTQMQALLRNMPTPIRSVGWFHVGGTAAPQVVTAQLVDYFDFAVACSPYTYSCNAIQTLPDSVRLERTAMVYGATDFARLFNFQKKEHAGFNVGYLGTLDFLKMHPRFVAMSVAAGIPDARFILGGGGGALTQILAQASELGAADVFHYAGYVENIAQFLSTIDVYGYPLCPETYAASEMNLQEVMFAGIPVVVFPYGGIQDLVIHQETGLIVQSEAEYAEALRYLHERPDERERLGANAHRYASALFGAHNAAVKMDAIYRRLMDRPKRVHAWGGTPEEQRSGRVRPNPLYAKFPASETDRGYFRFIESLGEYGDVFAQSVLATEFQALLAADEQIVASSTTLRQSGITPYRHAFAHDPFLWYWDGLSHYGAGLFNQAILSLAEAAQRLSQWRVFYFLALAAKAAQQDELRQQCVDILRNALPSTGASQAVATSLLTKL